MEYEEQIKKITNIRLSWYATNIFFIFVLVVLAHGILKDELINNYINSLEINVQPVENYTIANYTFFEHENIVYKRPNTWIKKFFFSLWLFYLTYYNANEIYKRLKKHGIKS